MGSAIKKYVRQGCLLLRTTFQLIQYVLPDIKEKRRSGIKIRDEVIQMLRLTVDVVLLGDQTI